MTSKRTALVLGAAGGVGGEIARQLLDAGWDVRALRRGTTTPTPTTTPPLFDDGIQWRAGDALDRDDVMRAARGCSVIVHAVNPPGYRRWADWVLPMIDNTIAAAIALGATIVLPGTVYNYGPDALPTLAEDAPQHPMTRKGAIRVELERRLEKASRAGARVVIVRAGDFFGPRARSNWFSQGLVKPGSSVRRIGYPGRRGIGHQWAYLPDVARTVVALLDRRDTLDAFARFHMAGHWDNDGTRMNEAIRRVVLARTGKAPRVATFPWWLVSIASPFITTCRELQEMRYLWNVPVQMTNEKLVSILGREPHTPLDQAVEATLVEMGNFG